MLKKQQAGIQEALELSFQPEPKVLKSLTRLPKVSPRAEVK